MATTPTNLPVPSESPRDLKFNAGKIDEFVTSLVNTYVDRFGNEHYTIEGLRWLAQQAISAFGYVTLDSFEDGNTLSLPNQVLRFEATGEYYRWDGPLPKSVPSGSTPENSGGIGPRAWLSVGDAVLRSMLSSQYLIRTPESFGAKGDGITDDTAAMQLAFTWVAAVTGRQLVSGRVLFTASRLRLQLISKAEKTAQFYFRLLYLLTPTLEFA